MYDKLVAYLKHGNSIKSLYILDLFPPDSFQYSFLISKKYYKSSLVTLKFYFLSKHNILEFKLYIRCAIQFFDWSSLVYWCADDYLPGSVSSKIGCYALCYYNDLYYIRVNNEWMTIISKLTLLLDVDQSSCLIS